MAEINFENVITEHGQKIFNLAYRMTGRVEDAQDAVQETYLNAFKNRYKFRSESSVYTWIYRICINESIKLRKKRNTTFESLTSMDFEGKTSDATRKWIESPENAVEVKLLVASIRNECRNIVMQKLTDSQRTVYTMRVVLDMPYADIAEILDIDVNTVKARLNRARNTLLRHFDKHCEWFSKGELSQCCKKKIGYLLSKDTEILKNISENLKDYDADFNSVADEKELIDSIYSRLPMAKFNYSKIKK